MIEVVHLHLRLPIYIVFSTVSIFQRLRDWRIIIIIVCIIYDEISHKILLEISLTKYCSKYRSQNIAHMVDSV